jgi:hypothetical protein
MHKPVVLFATIFALGVGHAHADLITNGSFENTMGTFVGASTMSMN